MYDHKHRTAEDELGKMVRDICKIFLRVLTERESIKVDETFLRSLSISYRRLAQDKIRQYEIDAMMNSLEFNRHAEETVVDVFTNSVIEAGVEFMEKPVGTLLPDWKRMDSALPDIQHMLREAVEKDASG
ncbi:hypothetical protein DRN72_03485 [Methanosarcinales archaeon]|nr:MAG: hypothetical protein DRN72_03485 [Methanosarcinales archaeon]